MNTNLVQYLSSIYYVKQPVRVSGVFNYHHQEVFTVYVQQLERITRLGDWLLPVT
jgi:Tfp pilus assembly protein PilO